MKAIANTSSSPPTKANRLRRVQLEHLIAHSANANVMEEGRLEKLAENIGREQNYPPIVVRPHPGRDGCFQILDGHQRLEALRHLGHTEATCYVWPCDDQTALVLLATLNRLEGQDDPRLRAELLRQLTQLASPEELVLLLPEDASAIATSLASLDLDLDELLAEFQQQSSGSDVRAITFAVSEEDERAIEDAVAAASADLEGNNRRGRALGIVARHYLEEAR
jgi:ParB-like chromosome segregation protein Spo0J